jgi:hypothetical protein
VQPEVSAAEARAANKLFQQIADQEEFIREDHPAPTQAAAASAAATP